MSDDIFKGLNKQQIAAVSYIDGSSIILAGAGSGKTRVLIHKVVNLTANHKVDPSSILMITFTNKAAGEMKRRITLAQKKSLGYVGTFHSFCALVLRKDGIHVGLDRNFVIYDDDDQNSLMKTILKEKGITKFTPSFILNRISAAKNQLITPDRYLKLFSDYSATQVFELYTDYEKRLKKNSAVDFDDLIMRATQLFIKYPSVLKKYQDQYRYIFVDEFQDTNYAQYTLTRILGEKYKYVTVVGDFSQSIYSWRGADIRNLEKFESDFPGCKTFHLEQNYRSSQKILDFAYKVIAENEGHPILKLFTENHSGEDIPIYEARDEEDEAFYVSSEIERLKDSCPYEKIAVLYRTNAQSRAIEESFLHYSIPYVLIGGTRFYERREVKDVLSYLRLLINPLDELARERILKIGKRKWDLFKSAYDELKINVEEKPTLSLMESIFEKTGYLDQYSADDEEDYARLENIKELKSVASHFSHITEFLQQVALVESEYSEGEKKRKAHEGVRLMTLHQAKGLEFAIVFIVGVEEGILPHSRATEDYFQMEEERRLFYVGITRAQDKLHISYAKRRFLYGRRGEGVRSRFLGEDGDKIDW